MYWILNIFNFKISHIDTPTTLYILLFALFIVVKLTKTHVLETYSLSL